MTKIIHKELSYEVQGVLMDVHKTLGPKLPEKFYQTAVSIGLEEKNIAHQNEKAFKVFYHNQQVGLYYVDTWIEGGKILLEHKVSPQIEGLHKAQAISYLKVTNADLAIVSNFGSQSLSFERLPNYISQKIPQIVWEKRPLQANLLFPNLSSKVLEACFQVYLSFGPGFLSQIYRRATIIELNRQNIQFEYIKQIPVIYQGHQLGWQDARILKIENRLLLAAFAVQKIDDVMKEKFKTYLQLLSLQFGLLVNFYGTQLDVAVVRRL